MIVLSPFEVTASTESSYIEANTLAGNRLNSELRDLGNAVQVINTQFLQDTAATSNETLLQYTTSTEVGNLQGNFTGLGDGSQLNETDQFRNPSQNTRVRGLTNADNTRDYFVSDIPWDSYNVDRVDLQRGPNSILFGQGSPAGLINNSTKQASFRDRGEVEIRVDNNGTVRGTIDWNKELIDDQLAVRIAVLREDQKYQQEPAFADSKRYYAAMRYEPEFLKRGNARTIIRANWETGDIDSNRPRTLPPGDLITPWFWTGTSAGRYDRSGVLPDGTEVAAGSPRAFANLNKMTFNPHLSQNDNFYNPNFQHGVTRPVINGGPFGGNINPYFYPWVGNFGSSIGGPIGYYSSSTGGTPTVIDQEIRETWGVSTNGSLDGSLAYDFNRLVGVAQYSDFAKNARLEYGEFGVYKNRSLTDASVFNFYDQLIDGPNKKEWQDIDAYNINLAQTFFNDKVGFEAAYNQEAYKNGQLSLLTDTRQAIAIDMNRIHTDGTTPGINGIPYEDGTPNPNLGRPFIGDNGQFNNNSYSSDRENKRLTGFIIHDFGRESSNSIMKMIGKHTLTALWAEDEQRTENKNWMRYGILDEEYRAFLRSTADFNEGQTFVPSTLIYLGDSMMNASSAAGAKLKRPTAKFTFPTTTQYRVFDSHWAGGANWADPWNNSLYPQSAEIDAWYASRNPPATNPYYSTQSENPANYVGWTNRTLTVTDSESSKSARDLLTTSARLQRKLTNSKALVWQGHLLDGALVGTFGVREDRAQGWSLSVNTTSPEGGEFPYTQQWGHLNLDPAVYHMPTTAEVNRYGDLDSPDYNSNYRGSHSDLTERSTSWMAVVHFNELPVLKDITERWPVSVSAFYNESTNFQPEALRVDVYGEQIGLPEGETKDYGLLFESRDGKYSFKVTKYKTDVKNANSAGLSGGAVSYIGNSQSWGANWANQFQYDFALGNQPSQMHINAQVNNRPAGAAQPAGWTAQYREALPEWDATNSLYNYGTDVGEDQAAAAAREASVVAAWRAWQAQVDPRFYTAWGMDLNAPFRQTNPTGVTSTSPNGFALSEDSTSKGYEFELSAQPIRNLRLILNAAKTSATRKNIGGDNLREFINAYETALQRGARGSAGDLRIWWGGAGNETTNYQWYTNIGSEWKQRSLQEGTNVPELREWRLNAIATYDFTEGRLNGLSIGGGLRWQDEMVIGYPVLPVGTDDITFDIGNPHMGPAETNVDLWIGYRMRFADKVDWRIQLNVRNVTQGDDLIPVTAQPDGTPATYRIAPPRVITLTNTFTF